MSFTNLLFLTAFLPLSLLLYHLMKSDKARNLLLVALSWLFYAWGGLQSLVLLIIVTLWIWVTGQALDTEQDPRWKRGSSGREPASCCWCSSCTNIWTSGCRQWVWNR